MVSFCLYPRVEGHQNVWFQSFLLWRLSLLEKEEKHRKMICSSKIHLFIREGRRNRWCEHLWPIHHLSKCLTDANQCSFSWRRRTQNISLLLDSTFWPSRTFYLKMLCCSAHDWWLSAYGLYSSSQPLTFHWLMERSPGKQSKSPNYIQAPHWARSTSRSFGAAKNEIDASQYWWSAAEELNVRQLYYIHVSWCSGGCLTAPQGSQRSTGNL